VTPDQHESSIVPSEPAAPRAGPGGRVRGLFSDGERASDPGHRPPVYVRIFRYAAGSGVAALASEVTFVLVFGVLHGPTVAATVAAFLAGALPNWVLNRRWAWSRRDQVSVRREVLPYAAIVLGALAITTAGTTIVNALASNLSHWTAVVLVDGTFVAITGCLFVAKFVLFDRVVFARRAAGG
jgi:putative flippase GtrA